MRGSCPPRLKLAVIGERALLRAAPREPRFAVGTRLTTLLRPAPRRPRRPRGPGHRALRGHRDQDGGRRDARLPLPASSRGEDKLFVPARPDRQGDAATSAPAPRRRRSTSWAARLADGQDAGAQGGRRDGRRAAHAVRRAPGGARLRVPVRRRAHAAARGRLPVRGDRGPGRGHRRRQERHGGGPSHGPAGLRRRRLRQDRGRPARRLQGRRGRQADAGAGAHDDPRPAASRDLRASASPSCRCRVEMVSRFRTAAEQRRILAEFSAGQARRAHRHPPAARGRRAAARPRPGDRRRGAALRRAPEGAAAQPQAAGRRDEPLGDADPAHPADVAHRHPRHLGDRDAAARPPRDPHLHRRVPRRPGARGHREGAGPRRAGLLPAQPRRDDRRRPPSTCASWRRRRASPSRHGQMQRARAREGDARVPGRRGRRAGLDLDHRERHRHPHRQHADRRARRRAGAGAALPDPRAHRAQRRARLRLPALPERGDADQRGGGAPADALRPHRAGLGLQDRHARPRDPRRRQPARRRAVGPRRRHRLRDVRADARRGGGGDARRAARRSPRRCASTSR